MTPERETEIKEAAIKAFNNSGGTFKGHNLQLSGYREAFRRGARWADHNPPVKKEERENTCEQSLPRS